MQRSYEVLRQGHLFYSRFFSHHLQAHVARCHLLYIPNVSLPYHLSKQQQYLGLTIRQCITFNMVAVVVDI